MLPVSTKNVVRFDPLEAAVERVQDELARLEAAKAKPEVLARVRAGLAALEKERDAEAVRPVYSIRVPSLSDKIDWQRAVKGAGATRRTEAEMVALLREGVRQVVEAEQQAELLAIIDRVEEAADQAAQANTAPEIDEQLARDLEAIERAIRIAWPRYGQAEADREHWLRVAPLKAAQMFLTGWEGIEIVLVRRAGLVTQECLDELPAGHWQAIGARAMRLMSPDAASRKNFGSPSPSPNGQATSAAA